MTKAMVSVCPRCESQLTITHLSCGNCNLDIGGEFTLSIFDKLSTEEQSFLETFLKAKGSFKTVQSELNMTYLATRNKYDNIMEKLNLAYVNADRTPKVSPLDKNSSAQKEKKAKKVLVEKTPGESRRRGRPRKVILDKD